MAYSPPDSPSYVPPLPPFPPIMQSLQWRPPPPPSDDGLDGRFLAGAMAVVASLLVIATVCRCRQGYSSDGVATAAASAENARTSPRPSPEQRDDERLRSAWDRPSVPNPTASLPNPSTASLPAFRYSRSVKHNLTDGDEEAAATCSVCLGAFQLGEMVRLLPVCLHLYHVQCIDPWLAEHSTCPLCRSDTDRTMGVGQLPLHQTPRPEVRV